MHLEALTKEAKALLPRLCEQKGFYLAGGTALALQLGHRISIDFDFFSAFPIKREMLKKIEKDFYEHKIKVSVNNPEELTVFIDSVKVTFLHYPFELLFPLINFQNLKLASVREIAAMKAYTIGRRGSFKDYVDLYFMLRQNKVALKSVINNAEKKYGEAFNGRLFLEQLLYLQDVQDEKIKFLRKKITKAGVAAFFQNAVKKIKI